MKRIINIFIIILALCVISAPVSTTVFAASLSDNAVITLSGEIIEQEIVVKAYLRQNTAINGMTAEISYDTSAMTLKKVEQGTALSHLDDAPIATGDWDYSATPFIINWSGNENDDSTGLLLTMYFTVNETANDGEYAITLKTERNSVTYIDGGDNKTKSALIDGVKIKIKGSVAETIVTETTANTNNTSKTILIASLSAAAVTIAVFTVVLIVKLRGKKAWTKIE